MASDEHSDGLRNALVAQPEPTEPAQQTESSKLSPDAWAAQLFPDGERGRPHAARYKHGAAAALHGWNLHEHHHGTPMQLSREDYELAIEAATTLGEDGSLSPHEAALSDALPRPQKADEVKP